MNCVQVPERDRDILRDRYRERQKQREEERDGRRTKADETDVSYRKYDDAAQADPDREPPAVQIQETFVGLFDQPRDVALDLCSR